MRSRGCGDCEERPSRGEPAPALDKSATKPHRSCLRSSALAEYFACENCTWIWAWFRLLGVCAQVGYARRVGAAVQGCLSSRTSAEARGDPLVLGARSTVSGVRRAVFFFGLSLGMSLLNSSGPKTVDPCFLGIWSELQAHVSENRITCSSDNSVFHDFCFF